MRRETVTAILERLGVDRPAPDLAGLREVYAAWCEAVSFDNVLKLIHLGENRSWPLPGSTADDFFDSWLACGAGGTCWAGNGALHDLLAEIGFGVERAMATMVSSPAVRGPNHGSVVVSLDEERWIADASILSGEPILIPAAGKPARGGPLPRFEWLDGNPTVIWQTPNSPDGLVCRFERIGVDAAEWNTLHAQSVTWSPFNYELHARLMRGATTVGINVGHQYSFANGGQVSASPIDRNGRARFLIEELGITEEIAQRVPDDRPIPPRPKDR